MADPTTGIDQFIAARLPAWLTRASRAQINTLRRSLNAHHASQARLRGLTLELLTPQQFAEQHLATLLDAPLADGQVFARLEWLVVAPRFGRLPGGLLQTYEYSQTRENGLLRLMRNFAAGTDHYLGSGLVEPGRDQPLNASLAGLVEACRKLDVGQRYQQELARIFSPATQAILAEDKRAGFRLATEIAALKGDIGPWVQLALRDVAGDGQAHGGQGIKGFPGLLTVLGQAVADGLLIHLRGESGESRGLVLYLPSDPRQALRYFDNAAAMNGTLARQLGEAAYQQYFAQLISLEHRAGFLDTLAQRLRDSHPDLELEGRTHAGDLFAQLAGRQVQRVKEDARLLLVPTADVDTAAVRARHAAWKTAGLDLVNLVGLFIPVVGALLLGQLVLQTCSEVFEGVLDWTRGHQHEALEHMLGVAETLAATAVTAAGVGFLRSAFVDALEPVSLGDGRSRLWHFDPADYDAIPDTFEQNADGSYGATQRRWVRLDGRYHEVHRPAGEGPWRLRHPARSGGYGPIVLHNGERGWRLMREQPLTWHDPARMLDALWPQRAPLDERQACQVLQVAGLTLDGLRAVLVENRPVPASLGQALRAFAAQARIERFFARLRLSTLMPSDSELLTWCEGRPAIGKGPGQVLAQAAELGPQLFAHLTEQSFADDHLTTLIRRDFPGLPSAYVRELVGQASETQHELARREERVPLPCAQGARALLRQERLGRALAGLYLGSAYSNETGELALALLDSLKLQGLSIDLREGAVDGRSLKLIGAGGQGAQGRILVRRQGRFELYDGWGARQQVTLDSQGCVFAAIDAALTPAQRTALHLERVGSTPQLRERLLAQLPTLHAAVARLLGWPEQGEWFNPVRRQADGRVGYALSGRAAGAPDTAQTSIRNLLRALYPGLDEQALVAEQGRLEEGGVALFERLVELQDDLEQLMRCLDRWVSTDLQESRQAVRRRAADVILRAWRLQGEVIQDGQGQRLALGGMQLRSLPSLPAQLDFPRVTALSVNDSPVNEVPVDFLRPFSALTDLNLSANQLLRMPVGIAYLEQLRTLRLAHNQIRLDAQAVAVLRGLSQLRHLDLSYNRLETLDLRFQHLSRLVSLNLRHCRLGIWPERMELCGLLELADLRDNQLRSVPDEILQMPYGFRRAVLVERNPLSAMQIRRLYALDVIEEHGHLPEAPVRIDLVQVREHWLAAVDTTTRAEREALWQRLLGEADSVGLFRLLARLEQTADYMQDGAARAALTQDVWTLLEALDRDPVLCRRLFERARGQLSCADTVASRFSELQVLVLQARAETAAIDPQSLGNLLTLGRQLFRLERLERIAYQDSLTRQAAGEHFDHLALGLGYRVRLRTRLALPGQPQAMRYPDAVELTEAQSEDAYLRVIQAQTPQALAESLAEREFWRRFLRQRHGRMFEAIRADYLQRSLELQAQRPTLEVGALQDQLNLLRERELADSERLVVGLSLSYLHGTSRSEG
ncbi:NEL-type E3 ubiquitin ligase domain-containing protein [Pseudomonas sp. CAM1A]|uniref:NEL-type E3 ubiquitin ligase domain-containing protein n=1 Tax=Pseudomonas sp. CAM1A TaxID=3231717 RepID=UPI0039C692C0